MNMMAAVKRDRRIAFQRPVETRGALGGIAATSWSTLGFRLANVRFGTSAERREAAGAEAAVQAATFRVLADGLTRTLTARDRVVFDNAAWDIAAPVPVGRDEIEITAVANREAVVSLGVMTLGRADEADAALALSAVQLAGLGLAAEVDAALAPAAVQIGAAGAAGESDEALALESSAPPLDFMGGVLPAGTSLARADAARFWDETGTLDSAAADVARFDHDPATLALRGLLLEPAATNRVPRSQEFDNGFWGKNAATVTANDALAPDGTTTADKLDLTVAGYSVVVTSAPIAASAATWQFSVWLKGVAGGERLYLSATPDAALWRRQEVVLTTQWQRYTLEATLTATDWYFQVGYDDRDGGQTPIAAQSFHIWGAQVEEGAEPTSYVETAAASASRAEDELTITVPAGMTTAHCTIEGGSEDVPVSAGPQVLTADDFGGVPVWPQQIEFS